VPPDKYHCDLSQVHMTMLGRHLLAADLWDLRCGIDYLSSLPFVDAGRIGMLGLSQGGTMTLFMAAWDDRIRAAVVSGFFGAWSTSAAIPWNMCGSQVLFGMLGRIEHLDLAAAVAPRALMVESGGDDPIFPAPVAVHEWDRLRRVYAAVGAPAEACGLDVFEGGHRWNGRRAWPFLERWLGPS
jgi:dienelactone hydrolase